MRAVIGTVICWKSHANTRSGHEAAQYQVVLRASTDPKWFRVPVERTPCIVQCCAGSSGKSRSWAGQAITKVIGSSRRALWIGADPPETRFTILKFLLAFRFFLQQRLNIRMHADKLLCDWVLLAVLLHRLVLQCHPLKSSLHFTFFVLVIYRNHHLLNKY